MGIVIADRIIMFFLGLLIFFLPISKAVIETSASICIVIWFIKKLVILCSTDKTELLNKRKRFFSSLSPLNIALIFFILANFLSTIFSSHPKLSFDAFFLKFSEYILIFIIVRSTVNSKLGYRFLIWTGLFSLLFIGIDGIFQLITASDLFRGRQVFQGRLTASFINPNDLGSYLITLIPLALVLFLAILPKRIKIFLVFTFLFATSTLILTFSKGAGIAFLFSLVFLSFYIKKRFIFFYFSGVLIFGILFSIFYGGPGLNWARRLSSFFDAGAMDRKYLWIAALRMFKDNPIFGVGLGTFMENYQKFWIRPTTEISYAHNCYLQILAETGIAGFMAFISFLFIWFKDTLKQLSRKNNSFFYFSFLGLTTGLIAYLLNSFVDTNFYALPIAVLFWFVLGLQQSAARLIKDG